MKTISQIDHSYLASTTHILQTFQNFCCKIKIAEKSSDVLLLGVTNMILMLRFMKISKFYFVHAHKVVKSKDVIC